MAPARRRATQDQPPPLDWTPTQAAPEPILNSPYEEPAWHWTYINGAPSKQAGRRPASYWFKSQQVGTSQQQLFAEEERDELPLVNALREDVKRWRESGYRGAPVTKELFEYWFSRDRHRPLFFCQREAVETLVYLLEFGFTGRLGATGYRNFKVAAERLDALLRGEDAFPELGSGWQPRLVDIPADPSQLPLRRLGCKMATGSGKTLVMAMLITWAFVNRGRRLAATEYPNAVLVCAPNLTVKSRLQVLRPESPDNYYDAFDLVPAKYRELLNAGRVYVTNWHAFAPKSEHDEGGVSYRVVSKGEETNDAFAKDRLGELASRLPLLVLNDEGHHCWRPNPAVQAAKLDKALTREERNALEEDAEEARVWLAGLDRINNAGLLGRDDGQKPVPCVIAAIDLSATPFYLANSGYPEGSPFPWLVSDFGLVDAIESGIVKVPRLPVADEMGAVDEAGRPDPKYFRLWEHIKDRIKDRTEDFVAKRPKPEALYRESEGALVTLASQWKQKFDEMRTHAAPGSFSPPPVMIVVCDNTDLAQYVYEKISGEREVEELDVATGKPVTRKVYGPSAIGFSELANTEGVRHTVRIDSKLLAKVDAEGDETKDEAAKALRHLIDSVGKKGGPGEQVRCVVSVTMLTEGWDANNVTHILGIRAFGSQLLCEQVVGRGLRRISYTPDPETGKLLPEYVDVYGIPFSLIPFKGKSAKETGPDPVYQQIFPVEEKAEHEIRIPVVESYTYDVRSSGISCNVDEIPTLKVREEPTTVYVVETRGYIDQPMMETLPGRVAQTREEFYKQVRFQQVLFTLTQQVVNDLLAGATGQGADRLKGMLPSRMQIFPEVLRIIQQYVARRVEFEPGVDRRELALEKYALRLKELILNGIVAAAAPAEAPLLPILNSFHPVLTTADVVDYTSRPVEQLEKSHLNLAPIFSDWERQAIAIMDESPAVQSYAPNVRKLGFQIHYEIGGKIRAYEPDFVVRLVNSRVLVLEIKGRAGEQHDPNAVEAKRAAAKKWVKAVTNARQYGEWAYEICRDLAGLNDCLARHAGLLETHESETKVLPFRRRGAAPANERYVTCVPLVPLRAAAGWFSEEQANLDDMGEIASDWLEFDHLGRFEPGMFVARVKGRSMEPEISDDSYCLFRQPRGGSRDGRIVLVWHAGTTDRETGGQFTVKRYRSDKSASDDGWKHERITLEPLNQEYEPIVLTPAAEGDIRVLAEYVGVVGAVRAG